MAKDNEGFLAGLGDGPGGPPSIVVISGDFKSCEADGAEITITLHVPGLSEEDISRTRSFLENLTKLQRVIISATL